MYIFFFSYMFHSSWDISTSLCGQIGKKRLNEGKRALDRLSRNDEADARFIWLRGDIRKKARRPTITLLTTIFKCRVRTLEDAALSFYTLFLVPTTKLSFVLSSQNEWKVWILYYYTTLHIAKSKRNLIFLRILVNSWLFISSFLALLAVVFMVKEGFVSMRNNFRLFLFDFMDFILSSPVLRCQNMLWCVSMREKFAIARQKYCALHILQ